MCGTFIAGCIVGALVTFLIIAMYCCFAMAAEEERKTMLEKQPEDLYNEADEKEWGNGD